MQDLVIKSLLLPLVIGFIVLLGVGELVVLLVKRADTKHRTRA